MRHILFLFIFSLFSFSSYAQKTDTVWLNSKWEKSVKEKSSYYRVIKTTKHPKNFAVTDYYITGEKQMFGNYLSLDEPKVMNGEFIWWYRNGNKKAEHTYENNVLLKETEWDSQGNVTKQHEFVKTTHIENGKEITDWARIDLMPQFPGGLPAVYKFFSDNFVYPKDLKTNPSGKIIVKFTINDEGNVIDAYLQQGLDPLIDKEALRVIQSLPRWSPGKQDGKFVNVKMSLPVQIN